MRESRKKRKYKLGENDDSRNSRTVQKRTEERASQEATRKGVSTEVLEWQTWNKILRIVEEEV